MLYRDIQICYTHIYIYIERERDIKNIIDILCMVCVYLLN